MKGMSFKDLEILCVASNLEKTLVATAPTDEDLHRLAKTVGFGERYGVSQKKLEDYAKELAKLAGPSPDKQDAMASTCFVLDSFSAIQDRDCRGKDVK